MNSSLLNLRSNTHAHTTHNDFNAGRFYQTDLVVFQYPHEARDLFGEVDDSVDVLFAEIAEAFPQCRVLTLLSHL